MVGDDIQGDIAGAQAAGIARALVRAGKFRPQDLEGDICPGLVARGRMERWLRQLALRTSVAAARLG